MSSRSAARSCAIGRVVDGWLRRRDAYLPERREAYAHPDSVLSGVRSIVMLALDYRTVEPSAPQSGRGRVSRYAWGVDYHAVIHDKLDALCASTLELCPEAQVRGVVDTAPLLEREFAQLAGLGWIGKNTLLLNAKRRQLVLPGGAAHGSRAGLRRTARARSLWHLPAAPDACPTQAFVAPGVLDVRRCISYLTIELRDPIPPELRPGIGDWLFGCDVCQEVCPWNDRRPQVAGTFVSADRRPDRSPLGGAIGDG